MNIRIYLEVCIWEYLEDCDQEMYIPVAHSHQNVRMGQNNAIFVFKSDNQKVISRNLFIFPIQIDNNT